MRRAAGRPDDVLDHIEDRADLIVPLANGEPVSVLDSIEANAERWKGVRVHQMHALYDRPYLHGTMRENLLHVSYFLSSVTRPAFRERGCELVPNHFSEVPRLLRQTTKHSVVLAAAAPMDRHGYFSLGTNCDYVAPFIGSAPFFLEVNTRMPRTFGRNQVHVSQVAGWTEVDRPLLEIPAPDSSEVDERIAAQVVERIPDGATIQAGIGSIPERAAPTSRPALRSRCAHRAAFGPAHRSRRGRGRHRHAQAVGTRKARRNVRARHAKAL